MAAPNGGIGSDGREAAVCTVARRCITHTLDAPLLLLLHSRPTYACRYRVRGLLAIDSVSGPVRLLACCHPPSPSSPSATSFSLSSRGDLTQGTGADVFYGVHLPSKHATALTCAVTSPILRGCGSCGGGRNVEWRAAAPGGRAERGCRCGERHRLAHASALGLYNNSGSLPVLFLPVFHSNFCLLCAEVDVLCVWM